MSAAWYQPLRRVSASTAARRATNAKFPTVVCASAGKTTQLSTPGAITLPRGLVADGVRPAGADDRMHDEPDRDRSGDDRRQPPPRADVPEQADHEAAVEEPAGAVGRAEDLRDRRHDDRAENGAGDAAQAAQDQRGVDHDQEHHLEVLRETSRPARRRRRFPSARRPRLPGEREQLQPVDGDASSTRPRADPRGSPGTRDRFATGRAGRSRRRRRASRMSSRK